MRYTYRRLCLYYIRATMPTTRICTMVYYVNRVVKHHVIQTSSIIVIIIMVADHPKLLLEVLKHRIHFREHYGNTMMTTFTVILSWRISGMLALRFSTLGASLRFSVLRAPLAPLFVSIWIIVIFFFYSLLLKPCSNIWHKLNAFVRRGLSKIFYVHIIDLWIILQSRLFPYSAFILRPDKVTITVKKYRGTLWNHDISLVGK